MENERKELIEKVKSYVEFHDSTTFKTRTTIRGYLELRTEQIRVLLDALCSYQSDNKEKMQFRDELLSVFSPYELGSINC